MSSTGLDRAHAHRLTIQIPRKSSVHAVKSATRPQTAVEGRKGVGVARCSQLSDHVHQVKANHAGTAGDKQVCGNHSAYRARNLIAPIRRPRETSIALAHIIDFARGFSRAPGPRPSWPNTIRFKTVAVSSARMCSYNHVLTHPRHPIFQPTVSSISPHDL